MRSSNCLRALRKADLSTAQSNGYKVGVSSPSELDLARALLSRDDDEALNSFGEIRV